MVSDGLTAAGISNRTWHLPHGTGFAGTQNTRATGYRGSSQEFFRKNGGEGGCRQYAASSDSPWEDHGVLMQKVVSCSETPGCWRCQEHGAATKESTKYGQQKKVSGGRAAQACQSPLHTMRSDAGPGHRNQHSPCRTLWSWLSFPRFTSPFRMEVSTLSRWIWDVCAFSLSVWGLTV